MENIGWIGGILLAICGLPEAIKCYKTKRCDIGWGFLTLWYLGEILTLIYIVSDKFSMPLLVNYGLNILFITVMIFYKIERKK